MNPAEIEGASLQAREGLTRDAAGLPCQERVDPGVEESGGPQWSPHFSHLTPAGHLMGVGDPGFKGWGGG